MKVELRISALSRIFISLLSSAIIAPSFAFLVSATASATPAVRTYSTASQYSATDPDSAGIACLKKDDTLCAVEIWKAEFESEPFNDQIRQTLQSTLIVHAMRSLDKGDLNEAKEAIDAAKALLPESTFYYYFDEIFSIYKNMSYRDSMTGEQFAESDGEDFESRYVEVPGVLGGQTRAFAMTQKTPGYVNWYNLGNYSYTDAALRVTMKAMSSSGYISLMFGFKNSDEYFAVNIAWTYGGSAEWTVLQRTGSQWSEISETSFLQLPIDTWISLELRIEGQSLELWTDYALAGQQTVLDYEGGQLGIAVGLPEFATQSSFSVLFDDVIVYLLQ